MDTLLKMIKNQSRLTSKYHSIIVNYQGILNFLIDVEAIREPALGIIKEKLAQLKEEYEQANNQFLKSSEKENNESNS